MEQAYTSVSTTKVAVGRRLAKGKLKEKVSPMLVIFFLVLFAPVTLYLNIWGSQIDPYRLFMVIAAPMIIAAAARDAGHFKSYDYFILGYLVWSVLCLYLRNSTIMSIGLHAVESVFAYALARFFVRDIKHFWVISRWAFIVVLVSVPIAAAESIYREHYITQLGTAITGQTYGFADIERYRIRWNLARATTFFSHPIHFGLFCATVFPLAWYAKTSFRPLKLFVTAAGAFFSLSSAAWLAWVLNAALIGSEQVTRRIRGRGLMIAGTLLAIGLAVQIFSKSGLFSVVVRYMAFDSFTAGNRIRIWDYGLKTMYANPIFGIDPTQWLRLPWMTQSLDNHWILTGVAFGFPGLLFLLLAFAAVTYRLLRIDGMQLPPAYRRFKAGWAIAVFTLALSGLSVAYFGKMEPLLFFILGTGAALVPVLERVVKRRGIPNEHGAKSREVMPIPRPSRAAVPRPLEA
jgi:hypothetical protein